MDFLEIGRWVINAGITAGVLTPLIMAVVKGSEKFGLSGMWQLGFATVFGGGTGAFAYIAFNGLPVITLDYFLLFLYVIMTAGIPIGVYETAKKLVAKK
jgi:hypothetical protein